MYEFVSIHVYEHTCFYPYEYVYNMGDKSSKLNLRINVLLASNLGEYNFRDIVCAEL